MIISKEQAKQLVYEGNAKLIPNAITINGKKYQVIKRIDKRRQDCFLIDDEPEPTTPESSQSAKQSAKFFFNPAKALDLTLEKKLNIEEHEELYKTYHAKAIARKLAGFDSEPIYLIYKGMQK